MHLYAFTVGCGDVHGRIIHPRFIGVIYPVQGDQRSDCLYPYRLCARSVRKLWSSVALASVTIRTAKVRETLSQINARGTFKLHSNHMIEAQPEIVETGL